MREGATGELVERARTALKLGLVVLVCSTLAYYLLGCVVGMNARHGKSLFSLADDEWELTECLYAAAITTTTVGYSDVLGTDHVVEYVDSGGYRAIQSTTDFTSEEYFVMMGAEVATDWSWLTRLVTTLQVIVGMAFFLYVVAQVTSFFTEGGYKALMWERRNRRALAKLTDHVVVCGIGETSMRAVERLTRDGFTCVAIDMDHDAAETLRHAHPEVPVMVADGTSEEVLRDAGLESARAIVCMLPDDRLNLVVVVTAKSISADVLVITRARQMYAVGRLRKAGADGVVNLDELVGMRAVSELVRPTVVSFLDVVMRHSAVADVDVGTLPVVMSGEGTRLADLRLREHAGVDIVALQRADGSPPLYNPTRDEVVRNGDELVVIGTGAQVESGREALLRATSGDLTDSVEVEATMAVGETQLVIPAAARDSWERTNHWVVCGGGLVGFAIALELHHTGRPFVIVESEEERCEELRAAVPEACVLAGDATDPGVLAEAGIAEARGLVTALPDDRDNLVMVVSALQDHPGLRTVAVARARRAARRLARAGAVVVPLDTISGARLAAQVINPRATSFLDRMREADGGVRVEGVRVTATRAAGKSVKELAIYQRTAMRVLAVRQPGHPEFLANPPGDTRLEEGAVVICVGTPFQVRALAEILGEVE